MKLDDKLQFSVHPSVILQLGQSLITDDVSALVELIKNSYDADASYVLITVEIDGEVDPKESFFKNAKGFIMIEDDGIGMDEVDITNGWLTVSSSQKKEMKLHGKLTPRKNRTPLGDKGLGRLGVQRLGRYLEMYSIKDASNSDDKCQVPQELHVGIDWSTLSSSQTLKEVPIKFSKNSVSNDRKGTKIVISNLENPNSWRGDSLFELRKKLSQFVFPFSEIRPFSVIAKVNGEKIPLGEISKDILDVPSLQCDFWFDSENIHLLQRFKMSYLKSNDQDVFKKLILDDKGREFLDYLKKQKINAELCEDAKWYSEIYSRKKLDALGGIQTKEEIQPVDITRKKLKTALKSLNTIWKNDLYVRGKFKNGLRSECAMVNNGVESEKNKKTIASPGAFGGKIYVFDLRELDETSQSIFNKLAVFREYVKENSGIRIFRDGFGIRPYGIGGQDWLGLGKAITEGGSYYGLKPQNVIGFISITARANGSMEEVTSREGFVDGPSVQNFYRIMDAVISSINLSNEAIRRNYIAFKKEKDLDSLGVNSDDSSEKLYELLHNNAVAATKLQQPVASAITHVEKATNEIAKYYDKLSQSDVMQQKSNAKTIATITSYLDETKTLITPMMGYLTEIEKLKDISLVLKTELNDTKKQLAELAELAALGITAEALSHEISTIASNLSQRTEQISKIAKELSLFPDPRILGYFEYVRSMISGLRKQLSHLAPSLKYVRDKKDTFSILEYISEIKSFYVDRFKKAGIEILIKADFEDFYVTINKGKLSQVFDNLILNAEYWLKQEMNKGATKQAQIYIDAKSSVIYFWDNGRGIDTSIEDRIFEPFITNKPKGQGRGLGLFIVEQLLDSSGCSISLGMERNQNQCRYVFRLDLSGVIVNGKY